MALSEHKECSYIQNFHHRLDIIVLVRSGRSTILRSIFDLTLSDFDDYLIRVTPLFDRQTDVQVVVILSCAKGASSVIFLRPTLSADEWLYNRGQILKQIFILKKSRLCQFIIWRPVCFIVFYCYFWKWKRNDKNVCNRYWFTAE